MMSADRGSDGVRPYTDVSFWLEDVGEPLTPRPVLQRSTEVDVAILGAGYTGLWTAYYLLRSNPGLRVAILEADIAGYGASGRNGGWCSPRFPLSAAAMTSRYGAQATRPTFLALQSAVAAESGRSRPFGASLAEYFGRH
jgi:glycine/D-amino acid oxidase-like deaminating enzyme